MLTPSQYEHLCDQLTELYARLDESIIEDITRRMMKTGRVTDTAKWQAQQLQESGLLYEDVLSEIAKHSTATQQHVKSLFEDAGVASIRNDNRYYQAAGLEGIVKMSDRALQTLNAGCLKCQDDLSNLTLTTANAAQQTYLNACNLAYMQVASGTLDYNTAIRRAIQSAAKDGSSVLYPSGHRDKLDVAVRRSVLTGIGQTVRQLSFNHARDMDCDIMELTAHAGARPEHAKWQGKLVSLSGKRGYLTLKDIGYGEANGFGGINCRHDWHPFFLDYSQPAYSEKRLQELNKRHIKIGDKLYTDYEVSQMQRALERNIREKKRQVSAAHACIESAQSDMEAKFAKEDFQKASVNLKKAEQNLKDFLKQTGFQNDNARTWVNGFGRSISQKAIHANKKSLTSSTKNAILNKKQVIFAAKKYALDLKEVIARFGRYKKSYGRQVSKYVIHQIGYDSLPKVVSEKEFKKLIKNNEVIYRGLSSSTSLSAKEAADNFKYGDFFVGTGVFGNGTYGAYDKDIADNYAELADKTSKSGKVSKNEYSILEMILSPNARIADYQTIYKEWFDEKIPFSLQTNQFQDWQFIVGDVGTYAALKGYDAIKTNGAGGQNYIIILNRGKIIVKE